MKHFLAALILASSAFATEAVAATYECRISPKAEFGKYTGVTPSRLRVTINGARVTVSDNVMRKVGHRSLEGRLGRRSGDVQRFSWSLGGIPVAMKPPTERNFYLPKVNYRARMDVRRGGIEISGSFVRRESSANSGVRMTGLGRCRRV